MVAAAKSAGKRVSKSVDRLVQGARPSYRPRPHVLRALSPRNTLSHRTSSRPAHLSSVVAAPAPVIKKKAKVVKAKASKGKAAKGKASKGKASKGKAAKDDKPKVKRAPGPYMIFCKAERPKIVKANPSMAFGEVGKALGAAWGKLSDAQKAKFKK